MVCPHGEMPGPDDAGSCGAGGHRPPLRHKRVGLLLMVGILAGMAVGLWTTQQHSAPPVPTPPPEKPQQVAPPAPPVVKPPTAGLIAQADPAHQITYANPRWSPLKNCIAYIAIHATKEGRKYGAGDLYLAEYTRGKWQRRLLTNDAQHIVWAPDGQTLALNHHGLCVMDIASKQITRLIADQLDENNEEGTQYHYPLSWSPDKRYLLFEIAYYEGSDLVLYDMATGKTINMHSGVGDWLPDGTLLFAEDGGYGAGPDEYKLSIFDPRTTKTRTLQKGFGGHHLARDSRGTEAYVIDDERKLFSIGVPTGTVRAIGKMPGDEWYWNQSRGVYACIGQRAQADGASHELSIVNVGDTSSRVIDSAVDPCSGNWHDRMKYADWSADGTQLAYLTADGSIKFCQPLP